MEHREVAHPDEITEWRISKNQELGIETHVVDDIPDYLAVAKDFIYRDFSWAIRGHSDPRWMLLPSVLRSENTDDKNSTQFRTRYEREAFIQFRDTHELYIGRRFGDNDYTSMLVAMQHYGIPTRLLDWTEDPLTALFFAICAPPVPPSVACVWFASVIRIHEATPGCEGNMLFQQHVDAISKRAAIVEYTKLLKPPVELKGPAFFGPKKKTDRVMAQQSVFSIHGTDPVPLDRNPAYTNALCCVVLRNHDNNLREYAANVLRLEHVRYFPDIYGFAEMLKRAWNRR